MGGTAVDIEHATKFARVVLSPRECLGAQRSSKRAVLHGWKHMIETLPSATFMIDPEQMCFALERSLHGHLFAIRDRRKDLHLLV